VRQIQKDYDIIKQQTIEDYYIHLRWTDAEVKKFRGKNVRKKNICVRFNLQYYSKILEKRLLPPAEILKLKNISRRKKEVNRCLGSTSDNLSFTFSF